MSAETCAICAQPIDLSGPVEMNIFDEPTHPACVQRVADEAAELAAERRREESESDYPRLPGHLLRD